MKKSSFILILFINILFVLKCQFSIKSDDFNDGELLEKKFTPLDEDINFINFINENVLDVKIFILKTK